jgi:hypothetical protein
MKGDRQSRRTSADRRYGRIHPALETEVRHYGLADRITLPANLQREELLE